ncbi:TolC family protein [Chitinophaga nivalis]|uniref:TolC family protein n=1 Tax=Chitinophaga nivalis TaxID=2991709 RepID=A0ABT3ISE8_9BACT|nr:TolC family protein [Chitinophaga nivalis]MCW3463655.1 TolC family protein [Chitinophaga nivalis]MCW3486655.1 TolC family protein [Chitinophaga nivalis]
MKKRAFYPVAIVFGMLLSRHTYAQQSTDSLLNKASLEDCVRYALTHQPALKQSRIDEAITDRTVKSKLADWYPQINLDYNLQHYLELPTSIFGGNPTKVGVTNTSTATFGLTQNLFTRDLLLATNTSKDVRKQSQQTTARTQIDVIADVSKAYYDVLLTTQQINVLNEDIIRLERSLKDAYNNYQSGVVDKTDYKRATISLNNTRAQQKSARELLTAKHAYLKQLMGYPVSAGEVPLVYDTTQMAAQANGTDTTLLVDYKNRVEYQLLETQQRLLKANVQYNKWSYLPTVSAFVNYAFAYQNQEFAQLFSHNYPNSLLGVKLSLPIFQGGKRTHNIRIAEFQLQRSQWDFANLRNQINTQYTQAMATYKSNLNDYYTLKENVQMAQDVYNMLQLQYKEGIKTYLEVLVSETELRSAQLNYYNAMYQVLSSKIDLQKALGTLTANY